MLNKLLYAFLYMWVKLHALLPMRVLYVFSDILYLFVYKIVGYRLRVVRRNMKASFPEKTKKELRQLERDFYHHFSDYIVETIKLANISKEDLLERAILRNAELTEELKKEGHTCFLFMMGHYGNWEWFTASSEWFNKLRLYQIYRPLTNKAFDKLFIFLRTRFGSYGIKKNDTFRDIVHLVREKIGSIVVFIADQTPSKANLHYWTTFLNQETPMLTGPERIAKKMNLPVFFLDVQKVKRGHYTVDLELITANAKDTPEFWITEQYARRMERSILRDPAYWLWTHKRWKHAAEQH
ncbi:lysophospholipid acyltransferase family protein [Parabacteroides sp. PF5-9]|uniref:lysophospholipid acyltransferase family protein n=1 Tax=Parabacteroides sp. PF5-9 TaxID=1742404 RepID=UPI002474E9D4|nr:lysophospholipid acyltransferase family protein [Parabacteroides sp. PF5-9]MDH6358637.1 KDO2-lipid IV(A) lauroyltransferase [Parabacteroides sp. PF5-9]